MKKIFRKVSAAVTALAVMFTAVFVFDVPKLVASAAMSVPMGNLSSKGYYIDANYNLTIANNTGMENWFNDTGIDSSLLGSISNLSDRRALRGLVASIEIQSGVTKITQNAFESCAAITSITIPESVTSIEAKAFGSCRELKSVEIKGNITAISNWTFGSCFKLESITIPKSVTGIGSNAFYDCRAIKSITIPSNVTSIGSCAFDYCQALATMNIENETSVVELGDYGFSGNPFAKSNGKINVPCNLVESYKTAKNWSKYAAQIQPSHLNTVIKNAKDATCGAKGYTGDTYCKVCDELIASGTDIPATGEHDYSICFPYSPSPGTYHVFQCSICKDQKSGYFRHSGGTATCTKKAVCSECNREYGSLAAHTTTHTATKAATCTANGNKEYWYCSTCRKYFSDSACTTEITKDSTVTAATGHSYKTTWSSDDANHWHECTKCGDKKDKTPHPWGNWTLKTKPDLTTTGTAERTCSCGEKQTKTGVPKLTDTTVWTKGGRTNPTENDTGTQTYTSADYGTVTITVPKLSDDTVWSKETTPATEDAPGKVVYTSSDYGTVEVVIPQLAHTHIWGAWNITTPPTLTKTGSVKRTCTKDSSHAETKTIPKLTDDTVWTKGGRTEPTLNGTGSQTYTSADYGDVTITIPKLTDDTVWTKGDRTEPTLNGTGSQTYTSADYGDVTITVPKLTDDTVWTKGDRTEPTLNGTGSQTYTSADYGDVTITIPKLTDDTVWTKGGRTEPTLNGTGSQTYTSTDYGDVTITIPKLTDDTVWTKGDRTEPTLNGTGSQTYTSTDYGDVTITIPALTDDTVWTKGDRTEPTLNGTGSQTYTSTDYGDVTITIPKLTDDTVWTKGGRTEPTLNGTGSQTYTSADYGTVTITIPKLTDDTVWTKGGRTEPTLNGTGSQTYTSTDYGDVTITIPALSDDTVWTKDDTRHVDPTEEEDGKDVYTSPDYGEVTVILTALGHTHIWGDWEITKAPAMDEKGTAKRVCTGNNAHTETKTLPVLTDTNVWTKDSNKHVEPTEQAEGKDVYTSEYGEVTVTLGKLPHEHRLTHVDEVPATEEKEGIKEHWHCDGCDKDFADENGTKEVTADDLKIGKIETEVQAPANVPKTEIATSKDELISAVLTEEEQEKVKEGTDIKIILKIEDASESTPAEDKEKIDTAIGGLEDHKLGLYLDITLLKKIGGQEHEAITSTSKPITVTFKIPEALRGMAKYSVIRIHNGETTVLEDEDSNPGTVTIKTDKFSTYALTYQDKAEVSDPSGDDNSNSSSDNTSSGNDNSESGENNSNSSSDNTSSGNGNSESGDKNSDNNNSDTVSSENDNSNSSGSSSDETAQTPSGENSALSGGDTGEQHGNPSTGIAISFVPLAAALAAAALAVKRKKK